MNKYLLVNFQTENLELRVLEGKEPREVKTE